LQNGCQGRGFRRTFTLGLPQSQQFAHLQRLCQYWVTRSWILQHELHSLTFVVRQGNLIAD
jgi:hypothetical protein